MKTLRQELHGKMQDLVRWQGRGNIPGDNATMVELIHKLTDAIDQLRASACQCKCKVPEVPALAPAKAPEKPAEKAEKKAAPKTARK